MPTITKCLHGIVTQKEPVDGSTTSLNKSNMADCSHILFHISIPDEDICALQYKDATWGTLRTPTARWRSAYSVVESVAATTTSSLCMKLAIKTAAAKCFNVSHIVTRCQIFMLKMQRKINFGDPTGELTALPQQVGRWQTASPPWGGTTSPPTRQGSAISSASGVFTIKFCAWLAATPQEPHHCYWPFGPRYSAMDPTGDFCCPHILQISLAQLFT